MRMLVFSVFDAAAEAFLPPVFFDTKGQMIRSFVDACNLEGHMFARHADDYTLFHIGFYTPDTGLLEALSPPNSMGNALQFVEKVGPDPLALEAVN